MLFWSCVDFTSGRLLFNVLWTDWVCPGGPDLSKLILRPMFENPETRSAYLAKLPGRVYVDGGVAVHHTDSSVHSVASARVSYDVTLSPKEYAAMRHFDENGREFRLPQEQVTARPSQSKPSPKARNSAPIYSVESCLEILLQLRLCPLIRDNAGPRHIANCR